MQHAHAAHIIHRDIKPQNVLVDQYGYIKVSDFGIARMIGHGPHEHDGEQSVMGTVHYFSPEQATGSVTSVASDLYSVGVVLYEMLTGEVRSGNRMKSSPCSMRKCAPSPAQHCA